MPIEILSAALGNLAEQLPPVLANSGWPGLSEGLHNAKLAVVLVVVPSLLIEWVVIRFGLEEPWGPAGGLTLLTNGASFLVGAIVSFLINVASLPIAGLFVFPAIQMHSEKWLVLWLALFVWILFISWLVEVLVVRWSRRKVKFTRIACTLALANLLSHAMYLVILLPVFQPS